MKSLFEKNTKGKSDVSLDIQNAIALLNMSNFNAQRFLEQSEAIINEQGISNVEGTGFVGNNIVAINQLPCEIIIMLLRIIERLMEKGVAA